MVEDPERDRGGLTKKDRLFLLDAGEEETKSSKGRVTRSRIRDRIYNSILDFTIIRDEVEARDVKKVVEEADDLELCQAVIATLEFLYQLIEETDADFEDVLIPAIERAEQRVARDNVEGDVNIEVDVDFSVETKLLLSDPDPEKYSQEEIGEMLADGRIDGDDALELLQAQVDQ